MFYTKYAYLVIDLAQSTAGPLTRAEVQEIAPNVVPPKVLELVEDYLICINDACRKVYWRGPKFFSAAAQFFGEKASAVAEAAAQQGTAGDVADTDPNPNPKHST